MIKYSVIKNNTVTNSWTSDYADENHYENCFGKPERWVTGDKEDISQALETREVETLSGTKTEYKLAAEYSIISEDITEQLEQEQINNTSLKYLAETDWLIIREMETGVVCPEEIKTARQNARNSIVR